LFPEHRLFFSEKTDETNTSTGSSTESSQTNNAEQPPKPELSLQELAEKNKKLEVDVKELRERTLRALAEAENARKIAQRDVENARAFGIQSFAKSLLDVKRQLITRNFISPRKRFRWKSTFCKIFSMELK